MDFEYDPRKAGSNHSKHGVSFDEAITAFDDPRAVFQSDPTHSSGEERGKVIGFSQKNRLISVIFTARESRIRIISARRATKNEEATYGQTLG